jgi:hypothetical protein
MDEVKMLFDGRTCPVCGNRTLFIGSGGYVTCSWIDCSNPDTSDAVDKLVVAATQAAAERARVEGIKRHIEEIEDISQSRDVIVNPHGTILCSHCTMKLETEDEECACEVLYRKRRARIERLRAELTGPGEGGHGKGL